jgi:hypothetical protein
MRSDFGAVAFRIVSSSASHPARFRGSLNALNAAAAEALRVLLALAANPSAFCRGTRLPVDCS